jgi:hypothetical protein
MMASRRDVTIETTYAAEWFLCMMSQLMQQSNMNAFDLEEWGTLIYKEAVRHVTGQRE